MLRVAASLVCTRTVNEQPVEEIKITKKSVILNNFFGKLFKIYELNLTDNTVKTNNFT